MTQLSNAERVRRINNFQRACAKGLWHPLMCYGCKERSPMRETLLEAQEVGGSVVLVCPHGDCDYVQSFVPDLVTAKEWDPEKGAEQRSE